MKRGIPTPTKAQSQRQAMLRVRGCVCCRINVERNDYVSTYAPAEIHHVTSCGRTISQDHVLPLCAWHHRGVPPSYDQRPSEADITYGPSLARSKRKWVDHYGAELDLLEDMP